jgi:hypothetical protein
VQPTEALALSARSETSFGARGSAGSGHELVGKIFRQGQHVGASQHLGKRRHDLVLAVTALVVAELEEEIPLSLAPDDGCRFFPVVRRSRRDNRHRLPPLPRWSLHSPNRWVARVENEIAAHATTDRISTVSSRTMSRGLQGLAKPQPSKAVSPRTIAIARITGRLHRFGLRFANSLARAFHTPRATRTRRKGQEARSRY